MSNLVSKDWKLNSDFDFDIFCFILFLSKKLFIFFINLSFSFSGIWLLQMSDNLIYSKSFVGDKNITLFVFVMP